MKCARCHRPLTKASVASGPFSWGPRCAVIAGFATPPTPRAPRAAKPARQDDGQLPLDLDQEFAGLGRLSKLSDPVGDLLALVVQSGRFKHYLQCKCGGMSWLQQGKQYRCFDCEGVTVESDGQGGWREVPA